MRQFIVLLFKIKSFMVHFGQQLDSFSAKFVFAKQDYMNRATP